MEKSQPQGLMVMLPQEPGCSKWGFGWKDLSLVSAKSAAECRVLPHTWASSPWGAGWQVAGAQLH